MVHGCTKSCYVVFGELLESCNMFSLVFPDSHIAFQMLVEFGCHLHVRFVLLAP